MDLSPRMRLARASAVVLFILALSDITKPTFQSQLDESNLTHLSWSSSSNKRFDLIFNLQEPIKNVLTLESDSTNYLSKSLTHCTNHSACLFEEGQFLFALKVNQSQPHKSNFQSIEEKSIGPSNNSTYLKECEKGSNFVLTHYCSTHWNPPAYLLKNGCNHAIEWHSPRTCHAGLTNHERPCYTYNSQGKLIDLTPWILPDGSTYTVDTSSVNSTVRNFSLNVCNEAHNACGPNVASCFIDETKGHIESGYNNLTSLRFDPKENKVVLTSLGQYDRMCENGRFKTVLKFVCNNKIETPSRPKLVRASPCENWVEWRTIHACPLLEVRKQATDCKINYEPLGIDIDFRKLVNDSSSIEIPDVSDIGQMKTMKISFCRGFTKEQLKCEGKLTSSTSACLVDDGAVAPLSVNNSRIVGSITKSYLRLADDRLYLETFAPNKTCTVQGRGLNYTSQVGARIEFFCAQEPVSRPTYLGNDDCIYVFEWGSPQMCLETSTKTTADQDPTHNSTEPSSKSTKIDVIPPPKLSDKELKIDLDKGTKTGQERHDATVSDSNKTMDSAATQKVANSTGGTQTKGQAHSAPSSGSAASGVRESARPKMNNLHKFFMISLIMMSLVAFIVVIFVLDKKTRLRIPLGALRNRARQAFQPQPVPYSRVGQFNDSLDL